MTHDQFVHHVTILGRFLVLILLHSLKNYFWIQFEKKKIYNTGDQSWKCTS